MNQMLGSKLKSFSDGGGEGGSKAGADAKERAKGMSSEEFEEYQKQLVEEKWLKKDFITYMFIWNRNKTKKNAFDRRSITDTRGGIAVLTRSINEKNKTRST